MKISRLKLKNIKCFKDVELSFEDGEEGIKNWSLIVGDNRQGKTTILRSLAAGLCDKEGASALLSELQEGFLRWEETEGSIEICLKDTDKGEEFTIKTWIKLDGNNESISQEVYPDDGNFKRENIFAVAYGAGRSVTGTESYEKYALVHSLYTLFNYEHALQNAELGARRVRLHAKKGEWERLQEILKEVLMLEKNDKISLEKTGLYIKTERGKDSFHTLSDGYKSFTSVVIDFLSWNLLYKPNFDLNDLSGIFIVDELEQHLHPRWQRKIIKILSKQFPNVQFICSTHTPICALGLGDLERSWLFKVAYVNGCGNIEDPFDMREHFKGYRADQILTSGIFDLPDTRSVYVEDKLEKYREIYLKDSSERNDQDEEQLRKIEEELKDLPLWNDEEEKRQRERLIKLLESQEEILNNDKD